MNDEQLAELEVRAASIDSQNRKLMERIDRLIRVTHLIKKPLVKPFYSGYICPECNNPIEPKKFPVNYPNGIIMMVNYMLCDCSWEFVWQKEVFF